MISLPFLVPFYMLSYPLVLNGLHLREEVNLLTPECDTLLKNFADSSSNYTLCAVRFSHPIHACQNCIDYYMSVVNAHNEILNTEVNGTKCKDKLINLDRLEIIESTFNNIQDIWRRGYCEKCFEWNKGIPSLNNNTKKFLKYHQDAIDCIKKNNNGSNDTSFICTICMDEYATLNSFYESLKETSETVGICMDIVDSMNSTRTIWSDQLKCCKLRRTPEFIFLCCTAIITALPALFYLYARYFCEVSSEPVPISQNQITESLGDVPGTSVVNS